MPVEIRELVIKVTIEDKPGNKEPGLSAAAIQELKKAIVNDCVKKVLSKIENLTDR